MSEAPESVSSEPAALDLEAIRARHFAPKGRLPNPWTTHEDLKALIAEVERLRPQIGVFGLSRWQQKVLIEEVDLRTAEVERLRAEVAELRALGVSLHKSAAMGRDVERAAVVAWLRQEAYLTLYEATPSDAADAIESGEHRREETK